MERAYRLLRLLQQPRTTFLSPASQQQVVMTPHTRTLLECLPSMGLTQLQTHHSVAWACILPALSPQQRTFGRLGQCPPTAARGILPWTQSNLGVCKQCRQVCMRCPFMPAIRSLMEPQSDCTEDPQGYQKDAGANLIASSPTIAELERFSMLSQRFWQQKQMQACQEISGTATTISLLVLTVAGREASDCSCPPTSGYTMDFCKHATNSTRKSCRMKLHAQASVTTSRRKATHGSCTSPPARLSR